MRVWTKNEKFQESFEIFDENLHGKLTFFTIFYQIFLGFLPPLRKYIPLEDNTRFLQQFFRFLGGGRSCVPPPPLPPDPTAIKLPLHLYGKLINVSIEENFNFRLKFPILRLQASFEVMGVARIFFGGGTLSKNIQKIFKKCIKKFS